MDCKSILTKKEMPYMIQLESAIIWSLPYLLTVINLYRDVEWVESFLKNFQQGGEGTI